MYSKGFYLVVFFLASCNYPPETVAASDKKNTFRPTETLPIKERLPYHSIAEIPLPLPYQRLSIANESFGAYLRNQSLKEDATVYLYDGTPKGNQTAQFAVLDVSVSNENLQQCADAVMRLRAEYLYAKGAYDEIRFTDNEHTAYTFTETANRKNFDKYLRRVFGMCGTASLAKQLDAIGKDRVGIGDVLIKGGFPGHAVIVMDMAENKQGKKIFLLAQSYMPAQDIHILKNPMNPELSPWYELNNEPNIITPEYQFTSKQWHTWP